MILLKSKMYMIFMGHPIYIIIIIYTIIICVYHALFYKFSAQNLVRWIIHKNEIFNFFLGHLHHHIQNGMIKNKLCLKSKLN